MLRVLPFALAGPTYDAWFAAESDAGLVMPYSPGSSPGPHSSLTYAAVPCSGKTKTSSGEYSAGVTSAYETCPRADVKNCEDYYAWSPTLERYAVCQGPTVVSGGLDGARNGLRQRCVTTPNQISQHRHGDPILVKLCAAEADGWLAEKLEPMIEEAQRQCKEVLCRYAKSGAWNGWTLFKGNDHKKAKSLPWPQHVDGFGKWGWRHTARQKCKVAGVGFEVINVETLWAGMTVTAGGNFDKTQCGCATADNCDAVAVDVDEAEVDFAAQTAAGTGEHDSSPVLEMNSGETGNLVVREVEEGDVDGSRAGSVRSSGDQAALLEEVSAEGAVRLETVRKH